MKTKKKYIPIFILISLLFYGCFSAKRYNGASLNNRNKFILRYAFRDVNSPSHDGIDIFWSNVDSLLPDTYIKRFFYIKKNGDIEPRDPRAKGRGIYIYYLNFPYFIRSEMDHRLSYTSESDNRLEWRKTYFDHNGNIRKISQTPYKHNLHFVKGTGRYLYVDEIEVIDIITVSGIDHGYSGYDERRLRDSQYVRKLNDSLIVVKNTRGYIKYEGYIQNNYKIGEWKYYNTSGELERTKFYKLKDREDVRFPYNFLRKRKTKPVEREHIELKITEDTDYIINIIN